MSAQTSALAPRARAPKEIVRLHPSSTISIMDRRTCNSKCREVLKQYLISMSSKSWKQVTRSQFLSEREALDYVRERLPDFRPPHQHEN